MGEAKNMTATEAINSYLTKIGRIREKQMSENMTATEVIDRSLAVYGLNTTLAMYAVDCGKGSKEEMTAFIHERFKKKVIPDDRN